MAEHRPASDGAAPLDRLEEEAVGVGAERAHRGDRGRVAHREREHHRDDVVVSEAAASLLEPGERVVHRGRAMEVSSGNDRLADVLLDPACRLLEVVDRGRVAQADVAGPVRSERGAREHCDADLVEQ